MVSTRLLVTAMGGGFALALTAIIATVTVLGGRLDDLREDVRGLRGELGAEIGALRGELHSEIDSLRDDMRETLASSVRTSRGCGRSSARCVKNW